VLPANALISPWGRPFTFITVSLFGAFFTLVAVATDTAFYAGPASTTSFGALFSHLYNAPIITPLNSLRYNIQHSNLALHGLHPHYQHFLINLPQLLGPALVPLLTSLQPFTLANPPLTSALTGTLLLSLIPHQESRFLIPCIPLLLTCIRLPASDRWRRIFWICWIIFNALMAVLMGIYHQGGVIPAQIAMPQVVRSANTTNVTVLWWKTYPAPTYLIGAPLSSTESDKPLNITTIPLLGISEHDLKETLLSSSTCLSDDVGDFPHSNTSSAVFLAAPLSAHLFDNKNVADPQYFQTRETDTSSSGGALIFQQEYLYRRHINLDDMDFAEDGVSSTLDRVFGRAGLGIWRVRRNCTESE
jgi:phosphatidylinositol glycan class Z